MEQQNIIANKDLGLSHFIKTSEARLNNLLDRFQWNANDVSKCFNTNSPAAQQKKITSRRLQEPEFPKSIATANSVKLENHEFQKVVCDTTANIPERFSDLQLNFAREQKLSLYKFVAEQADESLKTSAANNFLDDKQIDLSNIVALKKKENQKRRKYRISKPTHIEEVRALVELQMQSYQEYIQTKRRQEHGSYKQAQSRIRSRSYKNERSRKSDKAQFRSSQRSSRETESLRYHSHTQRSRSRTHSRSGSNEGVRTKRRRRSRSKVKAHEKNKSEERSRIHPVRSRSKSSSRKHKKKKHKSHRLEKNISRMERSCSRDKIHKSKRHKKQNKHKKRSRSHHGSGA